MFDFGGGVEESGGSSWSGTGSSGEYLGGGSSTSGGGGTDWGAYASLAASALGALSGGSKAGGTNYTKKTSYYNQELYEEIMRQYALATGANNNYTEYHATNFDKDLYDVDALMGKYTSRTMQGVGQNYQDLARSVGTTDSSLVQAMQSQSLTDASTQLLAKEAELNATNEQAKLTNAMAGMVESDDAIAMYLEALKEPTETMQYAKQKKSKWGKVGSLAGGAIGAIYGGPAGAAAGSAVGGTAGGFFD